MELNDIDDAIIYLNRAILLSPDDFNVLINLGKAYEIKYYFLESIKFFNIHFLFTKLSFKRSGK